MPRNELASAICADEPADRAARLRALLEGDLLTRRQKLALVGELLRDRQARTTQGPLTEDDALRAGIPSRLFREWSQRRA